MRGVLSLWGFVRGVLIGVVVIGVCGCATMGESVGLGAAIGGTTGAVIGNQAGSGSTRGASTFQGALIGAGFGALIGYLGKHFEKKKEDKIQLMPDVKGTPMLTAPRVRRVWIPAEIDGEKYIDGHYIYVIEKSSSWSK